MNDSTIQQVLGLFDRTAWIVTSSHLDEVGGLVATFVNNASLAPTLPRLAVGIARHHHTWGLIQRSRSFAAHLVDEADVDLLWRFGLGSGHQATKYSDLRWRRGETGSPLLDEALAWVDCSVETELDIGDRTIYLAAIVDGHVNKRGTAVTQSRLLKLAGADLRAQLDEERDRDELLDTAAILEWRAAARRRR